jgi:hypothetical protein
LEGTGLPSIEAPSGNFPDEGSALKVLPRSAGVPIGIQAEDALNTGRRHYHYSNTLGDLKCACAIVSPTLFSLCTEETR